MHHSDRGFQYCSDDYVEILKDNNIKISMTGNSDPCLSCMLMTQNTLIRKVQNEKLQKVINKNCLINKDKEAKRKFTTTKINKFEN